MTVTSVKKNNKKPVWIAGIARGHNAGICLLKDGEIVFSIEEERLSRQKYDGGPLASMVKILEYTDKIDYLVVAHTQSIYETAGKVDYSGDDMYTALARKLGLISRKVKDPHRHPQVIDVSHVHHKLHAACAFYRSGWEDAVALIVDGAGTFFPFSVNESHVWYWEVESIIDCAYPAEFKTVRKHYGTRDPLPAAYLPEFSSDMLGEQGSTHEAWMTDRAGIVKVYEGITEYCGFSSIEAGKTMGLFPYGKPNDKIPPLFDKIGDTSFSNRNLFVPRYPSGSTVNTALVEFLDTNSGPDEDITLLENRRDLAYACQTQSQDEVVKLIKMAVEKSGKKRVVISGGYGLNCVANYHYLKELEGTGIEIYVEPISNDAGTAMGAALMFWHSMYNDNTIRPYGSLYLGPVHTYTDSQISEKVAAVEGATVVDATHKDIVALLRNKKIVTMFQGRSENGPRALGNRSVLFNPTYEDGKDYVNEVKRREYFRPFAGTILQDDVHDWFDLRGKEDSPHMMYAVNCKEGVAEKIPSIIHVDGSCRIQTVTQEQNKHYYDLIKAFKDETGIPMLFNTSFNLGGEPLVETLDDAIWTLEQSDIEYLYLPEYGKLITIPN